MTWNRWSAHDGIWCYAERREYVLSADERAFGLVPIVEARNFTALKDRTDEQDRLEAEYAEAVRDAIDEQERIEEGTA